MTTIGVKWYNLIKSRRLIVNHYPYVKRHTLAYKIMQKKCRNMLAFLYQYKRRLAFKCNNKEYKLISNLVFNGRLTGVKVARNEHLKLYSHWKSTSPRWSTSPHDLCIFQFALNFRIIRFILYTIEKNRWFQNNNKKFSYNMLQRKTLD